MGRKWARHHWCIRGGVEGDVQSTSLYGCPVCRVMPRNDLKSDAQCDAWLRLLALEGDSLEATTLTLSCKKSPRPTPESGTVSIPLFPTRKISYRSLPLFSPFSNHIHHPCIIHLLFQLRSLSITFMTSYAATLREYVSTSIRLISPTLYPLSFLRYTAYRGTQFPPPPTSSSLPQLVQYSCPCPACNSNSPSCENCSHCRMHTILRTNEGAVYKSPTTLYKLHCS